MIPHRQFLVFVVEFRAIMLEEPVDMLKKLLLGHALIMYLSVLSVDGLVSTSSGRRSQAEFRAEDRLLPIYVPSDGAETPRAPGEHAPELACLDGKLHVSSSA